MRGLHRDSKVGVRTQAGGWGPGRCLLHGFAPEALPEAVGCREDPAGVQDAPSADVLSVVVEADLPGPRLHRGLLPAHHPRGLPALPAGWSQWEGGRKGRSGLGRMAAFP